MTVTVDAVLGEALTLPEPSRMALVEGILASFEPEPEVIEEHLGMVRRRKAEIDSGAVVPIPGDVVAAEVRAALEAVRGR